MIEALAAKDNPALRRREAQAKAEGKAEGIALSILGILETRDIAVSPSQREEVLRCADLDRLRHWLGRAVLAASADEIFQD